MSTLGDILGEALKKREATLIDTITVTNAEHLGYDCDGAWAVYIGVGGEPNTDVCLISGVSYKYASLRADTTQRLNPHMHIYELK